MFKAMTWLTKSKKNAKHKHALSNHWWEAWKSLVNDVKVESKNMSGKSLDAGHWLDASCKCPEAYTATTNQRREKKQFAVTFHENKIKESSW